jgi:hypothetical protein
MKKTSAKKPYKPLLKTYRLVPITDPAVQAALDELSKMENPVIPEVLREHARQQRLAREAKDAARRLRKSRKS